jgi:hypothetical protein
VYCRSSDVRDPRTVTLLRHFVFEFQECEEGGEAVRCRGGWSRNGAKCGNAFLSTFGLNAPNKFNVNRVPFQTMKRGRGVMSNIMTKSSPNVRHSSVCLHQRANESSGAFVPNMVIPRAVEMRSVLKQITRYGSTRRTNETWNIITQYCFG